MLQADGITKRYPGVTALQAVRFSIAPGEVVGLIGENGAGKSTLIKVLGGLIAPDEGEIRLEGRPVTIRTAADATRLGIGVIHQELNDLDNLDVTGNVLLGREPRRFGVLIDRAESRRRAIAALSRLGLEDLVDAPQSRLSIAQRQLVEISKALSQEARILIMDEPTSSLTAGETDRLLGVVEDLRRQNVAVVYVSHRLGEVVRVADRVVALRDGQNAGELAREEIAADAMVRLMVGRDVVRPPARERVGTEPALEVRNLVTRRFPAHEVSFHVCAGEIVGLAGLVGAGRSEVVRTLAGVDLRLRGEVVLNGAPVPPNVPGAIAAGLLLAPEDRRREGLVTEMTVRENVTLPTLPEHARAGLIDRARERTTTETMRERLRIKTASQETRVRNLSGGNQQKVVLAKWLAAHPKVLIFDEPTRGIDVGARSEIYGRMRELADDGVAILMVSSDMEEVLAMSDRVLVMHEGRLAGELSRHDATEEAIMARAVGRA